MLIATGELYVDLRDALLVEAERVHVFPDKDTALAHENLVKTSQQNRSISPRYVELTPGARIQWDGIWWDIVNVGESMIGLVGQGQSFTEVPVTFFEKLVRESRVTNVTLEGSSNTHPVVKQLLRQADRDALAKANHRYKLVSTYNNGESLTPDEKISERTLRRMAAKFRLAQETYGNGYIGLLPKKKRGNEGDKLPPATKALINEFIDNDYETIKQKRKFEVYAAFRLTCERRGILPASYKTFWKAIKLRPRYEQAVKRQGAKAARLAHFLESVESEEVLLRQRIADREARNVLKLINNEIPTPEPSQNNPAIPAAAISGDSMLPQQIQSPGKTLTTKKFEVYGEF